MARRLRNSGCRSPALPFPALLVGRVGVPFHSLVAQGGLEFFAQAIINVNTLFPKYYAELE
jgi:hypothetical protein